MQTIRSYFESFLCQFQRGFSKGFSVLTTLLPMIEKWRESLDSGGNFEALLTDLSKTFDCLSHILLISKFNAYGLEVHILV